MVFLAETEKLARAARNAYRRAWAKNNPDKVKAQQERYWLKRAEREAQAAQEAAQAGQVRKEDDNASGT